MGFIRRRTSYPAHIFGYYNNQRGRRGSRRKIIRLDQKNTRLFITVVIALAVASGLFLLFLYDPAKSLIFPPCPFKWLTGFYCPGCGSLRATHHLLQGHIGAAVRMNSLLVISIPLLGILVIRPSLAYKVWMPWTVFAVFIVYWALRNIPAWPFILLAPR